MFFQISYVLLWIVTATLAFGFVVLSRQVGVLFIRTPPRRARVANPGPDLGASFTRLSELDLFGRQVEIPSASGKNVLLVFVSSGCPACSAIAPALRTLDRTELNLDVVLAGAGSGPVESHRDFANKHKLNLPYISGEALILKYNITVSPYALVIGPDGTVLSKGSVNHREDLESLVNAATLPSDERHQWAKPLAAFQAEGPAGR